MTLATFSVRRGASVSVSMRLSTRLWRLPGSSSALHRRRQVDLLRVHVVQQLLGVERIPLGAAHDQVEERPGHLGVVADELRDLGPHHLGHLGFLERLEPQLRDPGKPAPRPSPCGSAASGR